jgi:surface carbohydrate biosynthesis protein
MTTPNWLIIPIETKVRELYGKSLLAACAADAGMQVILGDQRVIAQSLHQVPSGVYIDKSVSRTKTAHFQSLRRMGFQIAAWCEEGLTYRDKAAYQFERIHPDSMKEVSAFFAWGNSQSRDVLEVTPEAADKIHVHGNPRFDFLRSSMRTVFEDDAREIVSAHGPYLLVNTNFSRYNRFQGRDDVVDVLRKRNILTSSEREDHYRNSVEHLGQVFKAFSAAIAQLAHAFPDIKIVVRPHPSENHDRWRQEVAGLPNVEVHPEGNAIPWMMGAQAVVHNACTTGVEAFMLERPTIAYVPVQHAIFNRLTYFPNAISTIATDMATLIALVRRALSQQGAFDPNIAPKRDEVANHVANASGELAAERIVRTIAELQRNRTGRPSVWQETYARAFAMARLKASRARKMLRRNLALHAYMDQKFPELTLDEMRSVLERIADVRGRGPAPDVSPHPRLASCFVIRARDVGMHGAAPVAA